MAFIVKLDADGAGVREIQRQLLANGHKPRAKQWHTSTILKVLERAEG